MLTTAEDQRNNNNITKHQINYYSHSQTSITSFNQLPTFTTANKVLG